MTAPRLDLRESQHPKCAGKGCQERNNVDGDGLAKNILSSWRAKQAAERARHPEVAQLELLQVAQSEA